MHRHAPIEVRLDLPVPPETAFAAFTQRMGEWWDPAYTPDPATYAGIDLDPRVGGEVAMRHGADRLVWGRVTAWEPGERYEQLFWLAHERAHPSKVSLVLDPTDDGSSMWFTHGGWTVETVDARDKFGDWGHLLGRYAALLA